SALAPPPSIPVSRATASSSQSRSVSPMSSVSSSRATRRPARGSGLSSRERLATSSPVAFSSQESASGSSVSSGSSSASSSSRDSDSSSPRSAYFRPADQWSGAATPRSSG